MSIRKFGTGTQFTSMTETEAAFRQALTERLAEHPIALKLHTLLLERYDALAPEERGAKAMTLTGRIQGAVTADAIPIHPETVAALEVLTTLWLPWATTERSYESHMRAWHEIDRVGLIGADPESVYAFTIRPSSWWRGNLEPWPGFPEPDEISTTFAEQERT